MTYLLPRDLPERLRRAGFTVVVIDGYEDRVMTGAGNSSFGPVGVNNHHTGAYDGEGDPLDDLNYATWMAKTGRPDLSPPLCQISLSAESVVYLLARGRANHAGVAKTSGSVASGDGNFLYIGIEWMLSGTQRIPSRMYETGVRLNAFLLDLLGSSEQAATCHYDTSVTGKWDIGDPDGISFKGAKVLDLGKFRMEIKRYREAATVPPIKPETKSSRLYVMHASMQFSDTPRQQTQDAEKIFRRAVNKRAAWVTGTEAGPSSDLSDILKDFAREADYRYVRRGDTWAAVQKDLIVGDWETYYDLVIPGQAKKYAGKGVFQVGFDTERIGRTNLFVGHLLTKGSPGKVGADRKEFLPENKRLMSAIGKRADEVAQGSATAFYQGDQNIDDRRFDTFLGRANFLTAQDELEMWFNTGHGPIDVLASHNKDKRVHARWVRVLDDNDFFLNGDHFLVEGVYDVDHLRSAA